MSNTSKKAVTIGIIADTHFLNPEPLLPQIEKYLSGVSQILHAGDVGNPQEFAKLKKIAPVKVVMGNKQYDKGFYPNLPKEEHLTINGTTIYMYHGVDIERRDYFLGFLAKYLNLRELCNWIIIFRIHKKLRQMGKKVDVVIFGHTHVSIVRQYKGIVFINPGAVFAKLARVASAGKLTIDKHGCSFELMHFW